MEMRGLGKGLWLHREIPEAMFVDVYPSVKQPENEIVGTEAGSRKSRI